MLQDLRESDSALIVKAIDNNPEGLRPEYSHFFDAGYIAQLFADPRPIHDIAKLLELAPKSQRPVLTREAASTFAIDVERARQALLANMFETDKYPPILRSPNSPPSIPRKMRGYWCQPQFLHELTQAPRPDDFSEQEDLCFKRLSIFLLLLAEFPNASFRVPLYSSHGGPYVRLMWHIVRCIRLAYNANSSMCGIDFPTEPLHAFNWGDGRDKTLGAEHVQYLAKDRHFLIVLDLDSDRPEFVPSQHALQIDAERVEAVIVRAINRNKNKGASKGKERDG